MNIDTDKVDEAVLALLYLTSFEYGRSGTRAWKGFDWNALDRLHKRGLIGNPRTKAKSVPIFEDGVNQSKELFIKLFTKP